MLLITDWLGVLLSRCKYQNPQTGIRT